MDNLKSGKQPNPTETAKPGGPVKRAKFISPLFTNKPNNDQEYVFFLMI